MTTPFPKPVVIYHKSCTDGFCAAWLFRKAFSNAEFIAAQYGDDPPGHIAARPVYIVDFSYPRDAMNQMYDESNRELVVLDHHKTSAANCDGLDFCVFDMNKCGARLAFEFLRDNGLIPPAMPEPKILAYVEDRDLWKWELESSRTVNAAIRSYPFDFDVWDAELSNPHIGELHREGIAIERYRSQLVKSHVGHAREVDLAGHRVPVVACTTGEIISDVAGKLAEGRPYAACYFDDGDYRVFSLRSRADGVDVSQIATSFGGGGHKHAAGFRIPN